MRADMNKECQKCQRVFEKPYTCSKKEWKSRRYCSHSCANSVTAINNGKQFKKGHKPHQNWFKSVKRGVENSLWKRVNKKCLICGCEFVVKKYRDNTAKFCSHKCSQIYRDEGKTTKYKRVRKSKEYKLWRKSVFERDDYTCIWCGLKSGCGKTVVLHADHIKRFAEYPELRFAIDNGRTLCIDCHKKTGTYGKQKLLAVAEEG